jgi:beta-N-acetylhexosaminidase
VAELARAVLQGLKQAGMSGVGKHFPGHGHVRGDSHHEVPVDGRSFEDIESSDITPFRRLIDAGLGGIMPAHVIYPAVDSQPAGFSPVWLKRILRGDLGFGGVVFSDDLGMEGASVAGGVVERARAALTAGCDMALSCNNTAAADELLGGLAYSMPAATLARLARLHGKPHAEGMVKLREDGRYERALHAIAGIGSRDGELPLSS